MNTERLMNTTLISLLFLILIACGKESAISTSHADTQLQAELFPEITVYKNPSCGCCSGWIDYLKEEGFSVNAIDLDNVDDIRAKLGFPDDRLKSCHTAVVDGYIIEGHVPYMDIKRLLNEKPDDIMGLSAPGMPQMSPGMASRTPKDYNVFSFTQEGDIAVYSRY